MTIIELTELQEKLRNAAHTSAIMHTVETNGWNELDHSQKSIAAGDRLRPKMDRGRRWIATGNRLRPEMVNKRWIPSRGGSRQYIDHDQLWMDDRRWMTGDGSQEMDHGRRMTINLLPYTKILRLCEVIPFSRSLRFPATKLQSSADSQTYGVPAAWLHRVRCRALLRALFRDTESCTYMPEFQCRI